MDGGIGAVRGRKRENDMKKIPLRVSALVLSAALLVPSAQGADAGFSDVPAGAWYAEAAEYCRKTGLMRGYGDGSFGPDDPLSRAQAVQVLYSQAGRPPAGEASFPDVPEGAWYAPAAAWAAETGVASGDGGGRFAPEEQVTRQQLAVMLWRRAGSPQSAQSGGFTDSAQIASYARMAVDWVHAAGLMSGLPDGRFQPEGPVTRAQAAAILARAGNPDGLTAADSLDALSAPSAAAAMDDGALLIADTYHRCLWRLQDGAVTLYGRENMFRKPWAVVKFLDGWAVSDMDSGTLLMVREDQVWTINGRTRERLKTSGGIVVFDRPTGLAVDEEGALYVSDTGNGAVRKIDLEGLVTTAASGLNEPMGLCWKDGVLYIAETGANRIVTLEKGKVTVLAGGEEDGLLDGPAAQAAFSGPQGVAVDGNGDVYVADTLNSAVRRIRGGQVETIAARDTALAEAGMVSPSGLLIHQGKLYICDAFSRKLFSLNMG